MINKIRISLDVLHPYLVVLFVGFSILALWQALPEGSVARILVLIAGILLIFSEAFRAKRSDKK